MTNKFMGKDGKIYKEHKPFYKRFWFWFLMFIIFIPNIITTSNSNEGDSSDELISEKIKEDANVPKEDDNVPMEYKNALRKAKQYSEMMHMSKQGIYDQLTSEYGEQFPAEATQYAIDNLNVDYNANALEKAKQYRDTMAMSTEAIREQLTSEYGEKFTQEEADYAIANLEK